MRKTRLVNNHIYYIFNRGVEKRKIFLDDQDNFRFIHNLFELNDENPVTNSRYYFDPKTMSFESLSPRENRKPKERLVDVLLFTLMPNHFHLLLRQRKTNGITKFIQKVCTGYTMYFNQKYDRVGGLFQGRFKAELVDRQEYFHYLPHYIHLNPLGLDEEAISAGWREQFRFLENYRWSSFSDYIGKKNFPSVTQRKFLLDIIGGENEYKKHVGKCLREEAHRTKLEMIQDMLLD